MRSCRRPLFFVNPQTFSSLPANQSYRPLVTTTLAIDYRLGGGLSPVAFHATSFGLFVVQCAALLLLFRRIMDVSRPHAWNRWIALFAATWYAVHTAMAETVNYIIARSDILSTLGVGVTVTGRIRQPGAGRPDVEETQPGVTEALDLLVEPLTRRIT